MSKKTWEKYQTKAKMQFCAITHFKNNEIKEKAFFVKKQVKKQ